MEWISKEDDGGFQLEAKFMTTRGVQRELQGSGFARDRDDVNGAESYIRYWPDGYHAVARINPRTGTGRIKVAISYYDRDGRRFRKSPLEGTLSAGKDQRVLVPRQPVSRNGSLSSSRTRPPVQAFAAVRSALGWLVPRNA